MKKILFILAAGIFSFASNVSFAQSEVVTLGNRVYETKRFRFGAFVAPTISYMKPTTDKSDDNNHLVSSGGSKTGFTYGLMMEYWFADNYGFASGLHMNNAKGQLLTTHTAPNTPDAIRSSDIYYKLNYLEIPVNIKMRTDPIENFTFFGQAGFTLGINVGKKVNYNIIANNAAGIAGSPIIGENEKLKGTLAISPVLLSMNIGVGAEYPINNKLSGYFGFFFNNGFLPDVTNPSQYKISGVPEFKDANTRLNNFAFRLGLFF